MSGTRRKSPRKFERKDHRVMVNLTESQHQGLISRADRYSLTLQNYIRQVLTGDIGLLLKTVETEKEVLGKELQLAKMQVKNLEMQLEIAVNAKKGDFDVRIQEMELERLEEQVANWEQQAAFVKKQVELQDLEKKLLMRHLKRRSTG